MNFKEKHILDSHVHKIAHIYSNPSILNLKLAVQRVYEEYETETPEVIGKKMAQEVLDTHVIGLQDHQMPEFEALWTTAVKDIRKESL